MPAIKTELQTLLWPLLCHIYIEMVKGRDSRPASDFLRKFAYLIGPIENLHSPVVNKVNGTVSAAAAVAAGTVDDDATQPQRQTPSPPLPSSTTQILFSADGKLSSSPIGTDGAKSVTCTDSSAANITNDYFKELIQSLSLCLRIDEIESIEIARRFRNAKYEMVLSLQALYAIKHFLAKNGHVIILHVLQTWFSLEIREALIDSDMDDQDIDEDADQTNASAAADKNGLVNKHSDVDSSDDGDECSSRLTNTHSEIRKMLNKISLEIKTINGLSGSNSSSNSSGGSNRSNNVRDSIDGITHTIDNDTVAMASAEKLASGASALPHNSQKPLNYNVVQNKYLQNVRAAVIRTRKLEQPMRVFNLLNADHKLCAGDIDPLECHLACAFDDSTIKLWQLNQSRIRGRKPFSPFSTRLCEWCLENCESSSDDDSDDETPNPQRRTNGLFGGGGSSSFSNFGGLNSIKTGTNRKQKNEQKRKFMEQRCEDNTLYVF